MTSVFWNYPGVARREAEQTRGRGTDRGSGANKGSNLEFCCLLRVEMTGFAELLGEVCEGGW